MTGVRRWPLWQKIALAVVLAALSLAGALAMVPIAPFRGLLATRIGTAVGSTVAIGSIERIEWFSYAPHIVVRDMRVGQPGWVGGGDLLVVDALTLRVPVTRLLLGDLRPRDVAIDGMRAHLVRSEQGRANWKSDAPRREEPKADTDGWLSTLSVRNARFTLDDRKRQLRLAGQIGVDARRLAVAASGTFRGVPATLTLRGGAIAGRAPDAPYPVEARLRSDRLDMTATGTMAGALNADAMTLAVQARAQDLKDLDHVIEAGLFGSQPIALDARVRNRGGDWFVDRIAGSIGRSRFVGRATVRKADGRTRIDAAIHASQFDFDDLSNAAGRGKAAALRARIGPRVLPNTRINLSKLGPTDGVIRFKADRLLFQGDSVFRSLAATLTLDHRDLRLSQIVAGMASGQLTGDLRVDHRSGAPKLSVDLRYDGTTLERLFGSDATVRGPARGRIRLRGSGDTIRDALAHADGRASVVAQGGSISATAAAVLGQDLGKTIGAALGDSDRRVALRCLVADFAGTGGVLVPAPLVIDTGSSIGRGSGRIALAEETIALTFAGRARAPSRLPLADPIRVSGTLSAPTLSIAGSQGARPGVGTLLKAAGRSIGAALGLNRVEGARPEPEATPDCARLTRAALD